MEPVWPCGEIGSTRQPQNLVPQGVRVQVPPGPPNDNRDAGFESYKDLKKIKISG